MVRIVILALLIVSCTPQKRLARLVKKNPELIKVDTINLVDTITITTDRTQIDTLFQWQTLYDTVRLEKNNLKVVTYIKNDTFYLDAECDTIFLTEIRKVQIPCSSVIVESKPFYKKIWFRLSIFLIFVALVIRYFLSKR